jgi:hypothetical protein
LSGDFSHNSTIIGKREDLLLKKKESIALIALIVTLALLAAGLLFVVLRYHIVDF